VSVEAITWALRQPVKPSSTKFVLVVLANCASGDTFLAYPSIPYLAEATGQDRKTVLANLAKLREWGLIEDTGKRAGATKQVIVYRVRCGGDLFGEGAQNRNSSENGTVPKFTGNRPNFPAEQAQKRDTETSGTVKNQTAGAARGTRLPKGWEPSDENKAYATDHGVDWKAQAEAFADYWHAAPGQKGVKVDWDATWRTWVRRSPKSASAPAAAPYVPSPHARASDVMAKSRAANPVDPTKHIADVLAQIGGRVATEGTEA
jgi:hypothetical protein